MGLCHSYKLEHVTTANTSLQTDRRATTTDVVIIGIDGKKVSYEHMAQVQMGHNQGTGKRLNHEGTSRESDPQHDSPTHQNVLLKKQ